MITFSLAANVDIFPHLNIAFGAQNYGPAISPGAQTSRSEPIHSEIRSGTVVGHQSGVPEIFEFRVLLIRVIRHPR